MKKTNKGIILAIVPIAIMIIAIIIFLIINSKKENSYDNYVTDDFVSEGYFDDAVTSVDKHATKIVDSSLVNTTIDKIMTENKYNDVVLLKSWYDYGLQCDSYLVLFDDGYLYNIIEKDGSAMYTMQDYELYLQIESDEER